MEFDATGYLTSNQKPWLQNTLEGIFELHITSAKFVVFKLTINFFISFICSSIRSCMYTVHFDDSHTQFSPSNSPRTPTISQLYIFIFSIYRPQSPVTGKVIHSKGKLSTVVLLNRHMIKLPSKYLPIYPEIRQAS